VHHCGRPGDEGTVMAIHPALWCRTSLDGRGTTEAASMQWLASTLSTVRSVGRPVSDETGLAGRYDFELPRVADLESRLGLRLEPRRGPVDVLVVDRISRPTLDRRTPWHD
jgi:hypothetical protein